MTEKLDLITVGEALIELSADLKLSEAETFNKSYGGDTLATAIAAKRMGANVGFMTKIGDDCFKNFLTDSWQNEEIDTKKVEVVKGINGTYFVAAVDGEDREISFYRKKTAASLLNVNDIDTEYLKGSKSIYSTGITQALSLNAKEMVKEIFKFARENNILTAYDPNYSDELWNVEEAKEAFLEVIEYIDLLFINSTRVGKELITIESINNAIKYFWDKGVKTVVVKSSKDGGYFVGWNGEIVFVNFYQTDIIKDTTGTSDVFNGAFLYSFLQGNSPVEATKFASVVAGVQIQSIGAIKSIPYRETVNKLLRGVND